MAGTALSLDELRRYGRHLVLPEVGREGQQRLKAGSVLIVGAGGLGSPAALYLAAAGVGRLGLVDFDSVEETNLQRQVLYGEADLGRDKLEAALERLRDLNPHVELVPHATRLTSTNALEILEPYDVIVDGSDNFPTRYLVNDACVLLDKPDVYGAIHRFEGQAAVFWGSRGPCYRCLFDQPPPPELAPSCAEAGVLGVLPGIVGSLQANEALKLLLGVGRPLVGRLLLFDALATGMREVRVPKNPACPVCSESPTQTELIDYEAFCADTAGGYAAASQETAAAGDPSTVPFDIAPDELRTRLAEPAPPIVLDVRTPQEHAIARLDGAVHIPLQELPRRFDELPRGRDLVVHCHHGPRSTQAVSFLRAQGFSGARNLAGGIDAWSREVDPTIPRY
ncbi:MAG: molybdopterin-synthase adenylyltransferase MoeB [Thermoanaerobaculia bacterium]